MESGLAGRRAGCVKCLWRILRWLRGILLAEPIQFARLQQAATCRHIPRNEAESRSQPMNVETAEILLRFGLAIVIIGLGAFAYWLVNQRLLVRARNNLFTLFNTLPNKPVLVYFTTPDCAPCKTIQRPAINRVSNVLGGSLEVVEIDATERPDLAKVWGVMSVPTTFVLDARGEARYVNNGVARAEKLLEQIQTL
jgi:thiol-disulfide isomerase/thioredoxin